MKVISVIEDENVIKKILKHLGLWDQKARPPPKANSPPMAPQYHIDYTDSQLPPRPCSAQAPISRPTVAPTIPPGGIVGFCLTHKAESSIVCRQKRDFLSKKSEFDALVRTYDGDFNQLGFSYNNDFVLYKAKGCSKCGHTGYAGRTA